MRAKKAIKHVSNQIDLCTYERKFTTKVYRSGLIKQERARRLDSGYNEQGAVKNILMLIAAFDDIYIYIS